MYKKITLEVSLKPFKRTDGEYIKNVCERIFEDWHPLLLERENIDIMLWCSDGSEILEWKGDFDEEFEWCKFLGTANLPPLGEDEPLETSLHEKKQLYMKEPPKMTYRILKTIIETIKEVGTRHFPRAKIRVGETFDIGPEFSISHFKYERHPEICSGARLDGKFGFVDSAATLHADAVNYAAYPQGIPEGLKFGTFLGAQVKDFFAAIGFDYLWLSNGLGFSSSPWDKTGKVFDGEKYYPDKLDGTKKKVFEFWSLFRKSCPDIPVEVRGTNNSVGIDYSTDGVPLYDIYNAGLGISAPPNSPWAPLNDNFGLELMGHLTRVAELPSEAFPFRYYIHDPWWANSPWYDRYGGCPSDIYLPMAISRIDKSGAVQSANTFAILSIDNSFGDMPRSCVNEPLPHILKAEKDSPDDIPPFVWVYPMREYTSSSGEETLRAMNEGDNFIESAINQGFPLSSVVSTDNFLVHSDSLYERSVLISPVPINDEVLKKLKRLAENGIAVIIYGQGAQISEISDCKNLKKLDTGMGVTPLFDILAEFGYKIKLTSYERGRTPVMLLHRSDGAFFFNTHARDTSADIKVKTPMGAPAPMGCETRFENGLAVFRSSRGEHRECRVFIEQEDSTVSVLERAPVNGRFRRRILVKGLKNAKIRFFTERGYEGKTFVSCYSESSDITCPIENDATPVFDKRFKLIRDKKLGDHLIAEGVTGAYAFLIEFPDKS